MFADFLLLWAIYYSNLFKMWQFGANTIADKVIKLSFDQHSQ